MIREILDDKLPDNRYLVFAVYEYNAAGGLWDFMGGFDSLTDCKKAMMEKDILAPEYFQVLDMETRIFKTHTKTNVQVWKKLTKENA